MSIDYQEWHPSAALDGVVLAYWCITGDGDSVPSPTILPDAHVEIVINTGDPVTLVGPAYTGVQPARTVVGLLEPAISMQYGARVGTVGIRLHSARAAAFLGVPARELLNRVSELESVSAALDRRLAHVTSMDSSALDAALVEHLAEAQPADALVGRAVDRLLDANALVA